MSQTTAVLIAKVRDQNVKMWTKSIDISAKKAGLAVAALGAAAFAAMKKISDYGAEIFDLASATGVSVEGVQSLGYAFAQTGGSMSSMGGAIRGLNTFMRTAATGSAEYINVLNDLGLEYDTLRAMEPEQAFLALTDAIGGLDTAMEKNIAATTIFGGRYAQQITGALDQANGSLRTLTDQFDATGNAMSGEQIAQLKQYSDALTDLEFQFKKLMADGLIPLMPTMQAFLEQMADFGSEVGPEVMVVLEAVGVVFGGLAKFIISAADGILHLNANIETVGGSFHWMISPVTAAAASIIKFVEAAAEADAALAEWEDSANAAATSQAAATAIAALYEDAMNGNAQALSTLTAELERLEAQGADTLGILDNLHGEQERLANIEAALTMQTGTLTGATEGLTQEQVELERSAVNAAIMLLELENIMAVGPTTISAQIAALREYSAELGVLGAGFEGAGAGDPMGLSKSNEEAEYLKENLKELVEIQAQNQQTLLDQEAARQQRVTDRIAAEKAAELSRVQEVADMQAIADADRAAANEKGIAQMMRFGTTVYDAAVSGKASWKSFWSDMRAQILKAVAMKGFETLLNFATGGGSGIVSGVMGFLGFSGGGVVPGAIPSASGGIVAGGRLGDHTLIAATPGERVLSRQQNIAYESNMNKPAPANIHINYSSIVPPTALQKAQIAPIVLEALREAGVEI